jgi:hypothetical protein
MRKLSLLPGPPRPVLIALRKWSRGRAKAYFRERATRGDVTTALKILSRAGVGNPPMPGDAIPARKTRARDHGRVRSSKVASP